MRSERGQTGQPPDCRRHSPPWELPRNAELGGAAAHGVATNAGGVIVFRGGAGRCLRWANRISSDEAAVLMIRMRVARAAILDLTKFRI